MVVGGEVTCPKCLQNDCTQRVSLIVRQVDGALSPADVESLTQQWQKGVAKEWVKPNGGSTWEGLGKQFRLAPAPQEPWWLNPSAATIRNMGLVLSGLILLTLFLLPTVLDLGVLGCVALVVIFAPFPYFGWKLSFGASSARKAHAAKLEAWSNARTKWTRTWYCARDNGIFVPGDARLESPERISAFL